MRAQRQAVDGYEFAGLVDPREQVVLRIVFRRLGRDQAQNDKLVARGVAQRGKITRPFGIEFEEERIDVEFGKQDFADRLIAAGRDPGTGGIAAADMHADGQIVGPVVRRGAYQAALKAHLLFRLHALLPRFLLEFRVADIGGVGVVDLNVGAAFGGEGSDLLAIDTGDVVEIFLQIGVDHRVDRVASAAQDHHCRRWHGDLYRAIRTGFEEPEIVHHKPAGGTADLADRVGHGRLGARRKGRVLAGLRPFEFDTVDAAKQIICPGTAAVFAVGNRLETDAFLELDQFADTGILDGFQVFEAHLCVRLTFVPVRTERESRILPRLFEFLRAEETADVICVKRRCYLAGHRRVLWQRRWVGGARLNRGINGWFGVFSRARRLDYRP